MFLLFAGCSSTGGGSGDDIAVLDGTKVLSRPAGYSFSEAVGEFSEYYYNLYAAQVLGTLYGIYENGATPNNKIIPIETDSDPLEPGFMYLEGDNTFRKFGTDSLSRVSEKYYLYDSLRYTIEKVESFYSADETTLEKQVVHLNLENDWNWSIRDVAKHVENIGGTDKEVNDSIYFKSIANFDNSKNTATFLNSDWLRIYNNNVNGGSTNYPILNSDYMGEKVLKGNSTLNPTEQITNYYTSPYYQKAIEQEAVVTARNYFQDAFEYAIYMFVLGYDYHTYDKDGNVVEGVLNTADAPYFDFNISYDADNGHVSGIFVNGWGNNVPIDEALQIAKDRYQEIGGYVGLVEKNIQQIIRFILEKVIGEDSPDVVNVDMVKYKKDDTSGNYGNVGVVQPDDLVFNRNYEAIVNNIVRYGCEEAPIGYSLSETGELEKLSLSNAFAASMITEYKGNYFFANYEVLSDGMMINDDKEIFKNIDAAEYQNMVIYPGEDLIGKSLGGMWLDFEYFEKNDETKEMLDELVINVGFRYYDQKQNKVVVDKQEQMKIKYGKNGEMKDEFGEDISDQSIFMIGDDKDGPNQVSIEEGSVTFSKFDNTIGGGVLDPFVSGTEIEGSEGKKAFKYLTGLDNARNYYKLNDSQSAGQYGTLNEAKFAGADGSSFIEIYFDIQKDPSKTGISYDFKVCLRYVGEHEDANAMPDIDDDFDENM